MPERDSQHINKRGVFFIGGFDPKSADQFFTRNRRETDRFEKLWDVTVTNDEMRELNSDVTLTSYHSQPNYDDDWEVKTDFHYLSLDEIVLKDFSRPFLTRLWRYTKAFADYVFSGSAFSFFRHAWRFALYFCYPAAMLLAFTIFSIAIGMFVASSSLPFASGLSLIVIAGVFYGLLVTIGQRYHVMHLMDLWSFSSDFIHTNRRDIQVKLDRLADLIASQAALGDYDEILLIGHSTGGALILDAAGRTIERHPEFLETRGKINVLTVGSTSLKIGLHPKAKWFRDRVGGAFSSPKMRWMEYQCLTDIINFYETNPAELMGIDATPYIGTIKVRNMLDANTYQRIKRNFFRVHYQFVYGNSVRYRYDFPAICFGPVSLAKRADHPTGFKTKIGGISNEEQHA